MQITKQKVLSIFFSFYIIFLFLTSLFGRSFIGLTLFGYRLGEYLVLLSIVLLILANPKVFNFISDSQLNKKYSRVFTLFLVSFFITAFATNTNILNPYTYRASSHIFLPSFFLLGLIFSSYFLKNKIYLYFIIFSSFGVYILSTTYFPNSWIDFFLKYSDKFDFVKGSDLLLLYIIVNYLARNLLSKKLSIGIFFILSALYFPLLLFKSKGAFIPLVFYIVYELFDSRKFIIRNKLRSLILLAISAIIFIFSTFQTWGGLTFTRDVVNQSIQSDEVSISGVFQEKFQETIEQKNTIDSATFFYVIDKRLYSTDFTANWRLQIWQDVFSDTYKNNLVIFGYGYKDIIPAMQDITRSGNDQLNQNVHNFIVNIYARGGIFQLTIFIYFYFMIFKNYYINNKSFSIGLFILPVFITSFFDSSMETVRFPILFYTFLGILCSKNFIYKKQKIV